MTDVYFPVADTHAQFADQADITVEDVEEQLKTLVAYKWAADCERYRDAKRDAEALRVRLWYERAAESPACADDREL